MDFINYADPKIIDAAVRDIQSYGIKNPEVGIILGTGLGSYAENIENQIRVRYDHIVGFAQSTVDSHAGEIIFGDLFGKKVIVLSGRYHFYEGHSIQRVVLPTRVLLSLGIKRIIITNAAGAINESYTPGDLMVVKDHINMFGTNPLIGENLPQFGSRFPDMTNTYDKNLRKELIKRASEQGLKLQEGVYLGLPGPSFETPAEIRAFRTLGADAVGMSSVPEAIVANNAGMEIIGISCQLNMAAGILSDELTILDFAAVAEDARKDFRKAMDIAVSL